MRSIVIVGNGIAGVTAADTLRDVGFDGEITLVGDEPHPAYSRPALSKALLRDDEYVSSHLLPPPMHGATERLGARAVGVDLAARAVRLEDGQEIGFDGLVIATGCRPRRLPERDGGTQLTLRTIEDALDLRYRIADAVSVIVVGAGPLGMEIASGARESGCDVTIVSLDPPMGLQLGGYLSDLFVASAERHGVQFVRTGASHVEGAGPRSRIVLPDGHTIEADVIVTAIGDLPNIEWLEGTGLLRDGALIADDRGEVAPGIVAAGDVAVVPTPTGPRRLPLWNSAIEHARRAAAHLVGADPARVEDHPYFWTEQFGLSLKAVGHAPFAGEPTVVQAEPQEDRWVLAWPGAAVAINVRMAIPKLRALARSSAGVGD